MFILSIPREGLPPSHSPHRHESTRTSNSVAQAFRPEAFLWPFGFAFARLVFASPFCHSERSLRSEDRRPIARLLCDESLVSLLGAAPLLCKGPSFSSPYSKLTTENFVGNRQLTTCVLPSTPPASALPTFSTHTPPPTQSLPPRTPAPTTAQTSAPP